MSWRGLVRLLSQLDDCAGKCPSVNWLAEVVLKAGGERFIAVSGVTVRSQGYCWDVAAALVPQGADLPNERMAILFRHGDVADDYVRAQRRELPHGFRG